jgi:hypothetical protein
MWRLAAAAILACVLAAIAGWPDRINHDVAMYLYMGDQVLHGAVPYVDVIDLNPPLIIYLNTLPAGIARVLGTPLPLTVLVLTWLFCVWSVETSRRVLARTVPQSSVSAVLAAGLAAMAAVVAGYDDFGQKEHLFALALIPFLVLRGARTSNDAPASRWVAAAIGFTAGVLACLKPHFLVVALAPELYWMARRRGLRELMAPELLAVGAAGLLYGLQLLLMPDAMRAVFFGHLVPLVAAGYGAYDQSTMFIARQSWRLWLPPLAAVAVGIVGRRLPGGRELGPAVAIAAPLAVAMMIAQHKAWTHHAYPAYAVLCVALALVAGRATDEIDARLRGRIAARMRAAIAVALAIVTIGGTLAAAAFAVRPRLNGLAVPSADPLARIIEAHTEPGDTVLVLSTSVAPAFPMLLRLDRRQASRYMLAFPLPMIYAAAAPVPGGPFPYDLAAGPRADAEARFRAELASDISARRPRLVAVATDCQACPPGFTLAGYLEAAGVLAGAMADYTEVAPVAGARVFLPRRR